MGQKYATRKYRVNTFSLKSDRKVFDQNFFKNTKREKFALCGHEILHTKVSGDAKMGR